MPALLSVIEEIDEIVSCADQRRRTAVLRKVTNLFLEKSASIDESHADAFDEVILRLSRNLEFRARLDLSEALAEEAMAPRRVVRALAFDDDARVAAPVLERSPRLDEDDLVAIAREKGREHLLALARRARLSERVTDALIARADPPVDRSVAGNDGAVFSARGFAELVERARADETLQAVLEARRTLSPEQVGRLVAVARERVRETLKDELGSRMERAIDAVVEDLAAAMVRTDGARVAHLDLSASAAFVRDRARTRPIEERDVIEWVKAGRVEDALAGLAQVGKLPLEMVASAYHAPDYEGLLFVVRAVGFNWATLKLFLAQKAGRTPPVELTRAAFESFERLSIDSAKRVLRFATTRERFGRGVGQRPS